MPADTERPKALVSWSSGKDSAWTLHVLREQREFEIAGLLTTVNEAYDRVAMHGVRRELVEAQARSADVPLWRVPLPWPCSNAQYEERMRDVLGRALAEGVTHVAFGDLFLEEIRAYRVRMLEKSGVTPLFPVWTGRGGTAPLARRMLDAGVRAFLTCVDPQQLDPRFAGRWFDARLLEELPEGCDPLGENGEFHTFCLAGPMFRAPIAVAPGEVVHRDGFVFADLAPA